jgi:hypothetical protein
MKLPTVRELCALPELALVPALLAAVDGLLASLQAQHGTLREHWQPGDPPSLRAARVLADELLRVRGAIFRYTRSARRTLRQPRGDDHSLPF